jgi:hypothetical protein
MERTFLKSGRKGVSGGADVPHRGEACPNGQILPIAVGFCLLLFGVYDLANCPICSQSLVSLVNGRVRFHACFNYSQPGGVSVGKRA